MKKIKYILITLIAFLIFNGTVNAAGICEGLPIDSNGDCYMPTALSLKGESYKFGDSPMRYNDKNNTSMTVNKYYVNYGGKTSNAFCLDPNMGPPDTKSPSIHYAREFKMNSAYDRGLLAIYQMYMLGLAYAKNQNAANLDSWFQYANVAMRMLTIRYGYSKMGYGHNDLITNMRNASYTLEGEKVTGTTIDMRDPLRVATGKLYYCAGVYACKSDKYGNQCSAFSANSLKVCENYLKEGYSKEKEPSIVDYRIPVEDFEITLEKDASNIKTTLLDDGDTFEQIVPVKINGLQELNDAMTRGKGRFADIADNSELRPALIINSITCDGKITCTVENDSPAKLGNDLFMTSNDTLMVKVTGKTSDFKKATNLKIKVNVDYYNPVSRANLAIVKQDYQHQRMVVFLENTNFVSNVDIDLKMSSTCKSQIQDGEEKKQIYSIGGMEVDETSYLSSGCCEIQDINYLSEEGKLYYAENCDSSDLIHLEQKCDTDGELGKTTHSYVYQKSLNSILTVVKNTEASNLNSGNNYNQLKTDMEAKVGNYKDELYLTEDVTNTDGESVKTVSSANNYCMAYTSEKNDIYYPGTSTAISGRYFVFNENTQPKIIGNVSVGMHTDYDRWKTDYEAKVETEKDAYETWQSEKNYADALDHCTSSSYSCGCCCSGEDCDCEGSCGTTTVYSCKSTGTYYNSDGSVQTPKTESYVISSCGGSNIVPQAHVSARYNEYSAAHSARVLLEQYKTECEGRTDVANLWKYKFEPELSFYYAQEYNKKGKATPVISEAINMTVSKSAEKYWPGVTTYTPDATNSTGTKKAQDLDYTYGGTTCDSDCKGENQPNYCKFCNAELTVDTTKDYTASFTQTLYYRPDTKYYSLMPNGEYVGVKDTETFSGTSTAYEQGIEIGYVYNVELTNYRGKYGTWFQINNIGHSYNKSVRTSNVQNSLNKYLNDNPTYKNTELSSDPASAKMFTNQCEYTDEEMLYERECVTCDPEDVSMKPQYIYRTISTSNLSPTGRELGSNWTDAKGMSARELIQTKGAGDIAYYNSKALESDSMVKLSNTNNSAKTSLLKDEKVVADSASKYNTYSPENLEYEFTLTTDDMKEIKKYNKEHPYSEIDFSDEDGTDEYTYSCHKVSGTHQTDGKECQGTFLDKYADDGAEQQLLDNTRENRWKYYNIKTGSWVMGSLKEFFGDAYPDSDDETYKDPATGKYLWP